MMRIPAAGAISRLGARLGERQRRAGNGEKPPLTSDDEENIEEFGRIVKKTIQLLEIENEALRSGDVTRVSECYSAKSQLLKDLTLRQPVIEPFLKEDVEQISSLRDLIRNLSESLGRNGELLEGMSKASRAIISEVEHIRKRQSLDGVYDRSGQRRRDITPSTGGYTKKI